jgi:hypothetical protein
VNVNFEACNLLPFRTGTTCSHRPLPPGPRPPPTGTNRHHQQAQIATTNRHKSPPPTGTNRHYRAPQTRLLIVMTWPRPTNHPLTNNANMIQHSNQPHTHFRAVGTYSSISTIPQPSSSDTVVMTTRAPLHYQRQIKSNFILHPRSCDPSLRPVVRE